MKSWLRANKGFIVPDAVRVLSHGDRRLESNPVGIHAARAPRRRRGLRQPPRFNVKIPLTDIVVARMGEPQRGDVVTFSSPTDGTRLIKRILAVPGGVVEMRDDVLIINGKAASYTPVEQVIEHIGQGRMARAERYEEIIDNRHQRIQVLPEIASRRSFNPVTVPDKT